MKWGAVGEREMGMGRKRGGKVSTQATWDQSGRESHHTQRRDSKYVKGVQEQGEGLSGQRGITRGTIKGIVPCASDIMPILYISC